MVYLIRSGHFGAVKIGTTENDPLERLGELQVGNPERLHLLLVLEGGALTEADLQRKFQGCHIRGEWYSPTLGLLAFIAGQGGKVDVIDERDDSEAVAAIGPEGITWIGGQDV